MLRFVAETWPASSASITLQRVEVRLRDVRLIGDTAPGDERTSLARLDLVWQASAVGGEAALPLAPPGIYATAQARVSDDAAASYRLTGIVDDGDSPEPFEVVDNAAVDVSISLDGYSLASGRQQDLELGADLIGIVDGVDWSSVTPDGEGVLRVDATHPQITVTREALRSAFALR